MSLKSTYISQFNNNTQIKEPPETKDMNDMNQDMKLLLLGSYRDIRKLLEKVVNSSKFKTREEKRREENSLENNGHYEECPVTFWICVWFYCA